MRYEDCDRFEPLEAQLEARPVTNPETGLTELIPLSEDQWYFLDEYDGPDKEVLDHIVAEKCKIAPYLAEHLTYALLEEVEFYVAAETRIRTRSVNDNSAWLFAGYRRTWKDVRLSAKFLAQQDQVIDRLTKGPTINLENCPVKFSSFFKIYMDNPDDTDTIIAGQSSLSRYPIQKEESGKDC